ncbi:hypothetical protein [Actinomyces vulturis]|uniref:hypothetical protein n=1 Tax=Actinomyces vulturis TaxID=1857645 RepID=UPI00082EF5C1|nr:hypothetical protein [Actinomyces vulturis]
MENLSWLCIGLADVNLHKIHVATPRRLRAKTPPFMEIVRMKAKPRNTFYEGLAAQPVADAILACRGRIETSRLHDALKTARKQGLVTAAEYQYVQKELRS